MVYLAPYGTIIQTNLAYHLCDGLRHRDTKKNENTIEEIYEFSTYKIHIWRRTTSGDNIEPAILFFHGGGWMINDVALHRRFYSNIAVHTKMTVAAIAYRLSDVAVFPGLRQLLNKIGFQL